MSSKTKKPKPVKKETSAGEVSESDSANNCEEIQAKFEHELIWCIEQLQLGLETSNPNSRQAIEGTKALKILLSSKAPVIKKRQVMRNTFGDYRKKMAEMEHKSTLAARKGKISTPEIKNMQKSTFFKRSVSRKSETPISVPKDSDDRFSEDQSKNSSGDNNVIQSSSIKTDTDLTSSFNFNFKIDETVPVESETTNVNIDNKSEGINSLNTTCIVKSDNSFRFNFTIPS